MSCTVLTWTSCNALPNNKRSCQYLAVNGIALLSAGLALGCLSLCYILDIAAFLEWLGVDAASTSTQSVIVALLGLCLYPSARATVCRTFAGSTSGGTQGCGSTMADSTECSSVGAAAGSTHQPTAELLAAFNASQQGHVPSSACRSDDTASLSSSTCSSTTNRRRSFTLRIPRVSVELTPLPRLSLGFQQPLARPKWRPGMIRIRSGQDLCGLLPPVNVTACSRRRSRELAAERCRLELLPSPTLAHVPTPAAFSSCSSSTAGLADAAQQEQQQLAHPCEATASVGQDLLLPEAKGVDETIQVMHLLQFGAMLGETSCRAQLQQMEAGGPVGHPSSFYGSSDTDGFYSPWEPLVQEVTPGAVHYWAWRRPLRKGLYMYMTRTVFLEADPAEVRQFMLDDAYRLQWDNSMSRLQHVAPSEAAVAAAGAASGAGDSGFLFAQVKFPKPMASRTYTYGRRVWLRPADGGCYCLARNCSHPAAPVVGGRSVAVEDYVSGSVVRAPAQHLLPQGYSGPAAEVLMIYFEDSLVRPGLANMGIKKGLWPMVQRTDKALRVYQQSGPQGTASATGMLPDGDRSSSAGWSASAAGCGSNQQHSSSKGGSWLQALSSAGATLGAALTRGVLAPARALQSMLQQLQQAQRRVAGLVPALEWRLLRWLAQACSLPLHRLALTLSAAPTAVAASGKAEACLHVTDAVAAVKSFPVPAAGSEVKEWPLQHLEQPHHHYLAPPMLANARRRGSGSGARVARQHKPGSRSCSGTPVSKLQPQQQRLSFSSGLGPCGSSRSTVEAPSGLHRVNSHPLTEAAAVEGWLEGGSPVVNSMAMAADAAAGDDRLWSCTSAPLMDLLSEGQGEPAQLGAAGQAASCSPQQATAACLEWVANSQGAACASTSGSAAGGHPQTSRLAVASRGGLTRSYSIDSRDLASETGGSSRSSSRGGASSRSSRRSKQQRIVVGLVQAAGVRLAHHLLVSHGHHG